MPPQQCTEANGTCERGRQPAAMPATGSGHFGWRTRRLARRKEARNLAVVETPTFQASRHPANKERHRGTTHWTKGWSAVPRLRASAVRRRARNGTRGRSRNAQGRQALDDRSRRFHAAWAKSRRRPAPRSPWRPACDRRRSHGRPQPGDATSARNASSADVAPSSPGTPGRPRHPRQVWIERESLPGRTGPESR